MECVVFCRPSLLQLSMYRHLLTSRVVRSCLTSHSSGGSRHLVCIGALKKLCNDPSLIYSHCQEAKEMEDSLDVDEVSYFWSAGHLKQTRMVCCCVDPLGLSNFMAIYFKNFTFKSNSPESSSVSLSIWPHKKWPSFIFKLFILVKNGSIRLILT